MNEPTVLIANRGDERRRLDLMLRRHLMGLERPSRTRVQAWIEAGHVSINGALVRRVATRLALGDVVGIALPGNCENPAAGTSAMAPEEAYVEVLYEDDFLLAVNKPAGTVVHPTYRNMTGTIMNALLWRSRRWPLGQRPSIVGRLDRLTSGIVLVAKSSAAHAALQCAMAAREADKTYLAVVFGSVNPASGAIDLRLRRSSDDRRRVVASPSLGAASLTRFERVASVAAPQAGLSLLRCALATGRTHQIRVHLAARGWPIVGDPVYGEPYWSKVCDPTLATALRIFPRQALHASRLTLTHPFTGARLSVQAPLPVDLQQLLAATGLPVSP